MDVLSVVSVKQAEGGNPRSEVREEKSESRSRKSEKKQIRNPKQIQKL
jgi:hypothetical protein